MSMDLAALRKALQDQNQTLSVLTPRLSTIRDIYTEAYGQREQTYQATIGELVDRLVDAWQAMGADLFEPVQTRRIEEVDLIETRRRVLRDRLLPELQAQIDSLVKRSQTDRTRRHRTSVIEDDREEELKALVQRFEAELDQLNAEIQAQARRLGVIRHFGKLRRLTGRRSEVLKELARLQAEIRDVRSDWRTSEMQMGAQENTQQQEVQAALQKRSRWQAELDYLDDAAQREQLARQRAVRYVLDELREPVTSPLPDLESSVNDLAALNVARDQYQEALKKVSHLLGLLQGIGQGVTKFIESLEKLMQQQKQYSAYLKPLRISVPASIGRFFQQFTTLYQAVQNPAAFRDRPVIFSKLAAEFIASAGDDAIKATFESLGAALNQATTQQWG
ncbi:MAG: hypothetical protein JXB35_00800 [Anaerolineae bacterium]|nr:hypothetical protein [Anaerolineae bacterium]